MNENVQIDPDYVPPALFALAYDHSNVVHAAHDEEMTLCSVTTWGQMERFDEPPEDKRLCNNCSLILRNRGTWQNSAWAQRWLERRRVEERG